MLFFLAGNGAAEFTSVSQDVINSPIIPPQVKPIFQCFIAALAELKPCMEQPNLQCLRDAFKNVGEKGMEDAESLTQGSLHQLFVNLWNLDEVAIERMDALPKDAGQQAVEIADSTLSTKANLIKEFLKQPNA